MYTSYTVYNELFLCTQKKSQQNNGESEGCTQVIQCITNCSFVLRKNLSRTMGRVRDVHKLYSV